MEQEGKEKEISACGEAEVGAAEWRGIERSEICMQCGKIFIYYGYEDQWVCPSCVEKTLKRWGVKDRKEEEVKE